VRRLHRIGAVAAAAMLAAMIVPVSMAAGDDGAKWTFAVYLDADNNLEPYALMNLEWLEKVGSTLDVNFVVLMDTYKAIKGTHWYEVDGPKEPHIELVDGVYQNSCDCELIAGGCPGELNMADPAVLEEFCEIVCSEYPAERNALILWDHGGGWRGLCWDDTTYELDDVDDCLTMVELRDALVNAKVVTNVVFDVIGFDLCLMAMPEVAYQVRDCADYVVFSEETVPAAGFPYDAIAEHLITEPTMSGSALSSVIVQDYAAYYGSTSGYVDWTISAFNMTYMGAMTDAVEDLGAALLAGLRVYMNSIQRDLIQAQEYYYPYNVDMKGFAMNLQADPIIKDMAIKTAAKAVQEVVELGVVDFENGLHNYKSYGMAIYAPSTNDGMHSMKDTYEDVPFAMDTGWYYFASAFSDFHGRTWGLGDW
jgi:hypothetical protein